MYYGKLIKKIVEKANDKLEQQCGLRPFRATYRPFDLLDNDDFWKAYFGFSESIDISIPLRDGRRLFLPAWIYHKRRAKRYKNMFDYFLKMEGIEKW